MEKHEEQRIQTAVLNGYQDLSAGRFFASTGDFVNDMALLECKESENWQS